MPPPAIPARPIRSGRPCGGRLLNNNPLAGTGKLTERIRRPNFGTLEVEMTIDDPASYTAPWTVTLKQPLVLDSELLDYYCLENEKDLVHMIKK